MSYKPFLGVQSANPALDQWNNEHPQMTTKEIDWDEPFSNLASKQHHLEDEDTMRREIDWNAPIIGSDAFLQEREPPPPNRAIYPLITELGWRVIVVPPSLDWAQNFTKIKSHLEDLFDSSSPPVEYTTIEHIGSTSIPNLCAKPNIDVLVTFPSAGALRAALEAIEWEVPNLPPFIRYTRVPNGGGIQGRESLKLYVPDHSPYHYTTPERSVYLINEDTTNPEGRVQIRCYRSVKSTLSDPRNQDLLEEYAKVKMDLATKTFPDPITYSSLKDDMIRKILKRGGWTDDEVGEKERLSERSIDVEYLAY